MITETDPPGHPSGRGPEPAAAPFGVRVGTDIQSVDAIETSIRRYGRRYLDRVFTAQEVHSCGGYGAEPNLLAPGLTARFCAKEAVLKALRPVTIIPEWQDIEIVRMPGGWVSVTLSGSAKDLADQSGLDNFQVCLSHDGGVAVAVVVAVELGRSAHDS